MNLFLIKGYKGYRYSCNRKRESDTLISAIRNSQDITLFGHRRFGKSALNHHVFHKLQKEYVCIYTDIRGTSSPEELFKFLHQQNIPVLFATDEFQEIRITLHSWRRRA